MESTLWRQRRFIGLFCGEGGGGGGGGGASILSFVLEQIWQRSLRSAAVEERCRTSVSFSFIFFGAYKDCEAVLLLTLHTANKTGDPGRGSSLAPHLQLCELFDVD